MFETEWERFPIIDWELGNKLAGYQTDLAKDMLMMLTNNLPNEISLINQSFAEKNYPELLKQIHKLHGAVCYCGAPRLKAVLAITEKQLKNQLLDDLAMLINHLNIEVTDLIKEMV